MVRRPSEDLGHRARERHVVGQDRADNKLAFPSFSFGRPDLVHPMFRRDYAQGAGQAALDQ